MTVSLFKKANCLLGESPIWHSTRDSLIWVDIEKNCIIEFNQLKNLTACFYLPHKISMIAEEKGNQLILGMKGGLALFDLSKKDLNWVADIEKEIPDNRTNDGKCDATGRLWLGTMHIDGKEKKGSLYSFDHINGLQKKIPNLTISNGITWALDNKTLYHIDSIENAVNAYSFNVKTGEIAFQKKSIDIPVSLGLPDGMTIDENGMLWIAQWDGFCVCCWNPITGKMIHKIEVPVPKITSCIFGGPNLDKLFITTASIGLSNEDLKKYPDSGSVFVASPGIKGIPPNRFVHDISDHDHL